MGIGSARGDHRAAVAAEMAVSSPLLEASIEGARGVLVSVAGGSDLGLHEINEALGLIHQAVDPEANIIFGAVIDDALGDEVRVTVVAAGFDGGEPKTRDVSQPALLREEMVPAANPDQSLIDAELLEAVTVPAGRVEYGDDLDIPDFLR
jgi:cell division protein FtsZ